MPLNKTSLCLFACLCALPAWSKKPEITHWQVDPNHSEVSFKVKHMGLASVTGRFLNIKGKLILNQQEVEKSNVHITIPVNTIDTGNAKRDGHLKTPNFFDVEKYPVITFRSTKIQQLKQGSRELNICGELTLHGVSKQECFMGQLNGPQQYPTGKWGLGFETTQRDSISRKKYGIGDKFQDQQDGIFANKMLDFATKTAASLIADKVQFEINVELIQQDVSGNNKKG